MILQPLGSRLRLRAAIPALISAVTALRFSRRRVGVAVVYHRVEDLTGDPSTQLVPALPPSVFKRQLALLKAAFELVPASRLLEATRRRGLGERIPAAITFDDDLESHARVSQPLLLRADVPATFFLCGAGLAGPDGYWWQKLQVAVDRGVAERVLGTSDVPAAVAEAWRGRPEDIHDVAAAMRGLEPPIRDALADRLAAAGRLSVLPEAPLSVAGIRSIAEARFEVGFHTLRHEYLPALDDESLAEALTTGRDRLADVVGRPLELLAYPHGGADERVTAAARAAGYAFAFTTAAEAVRPSTDELLLGRVECSYRSASELALRLGSALRGV